ncbi:hypothetical protein PSAB6_590005 [Paraburkholderia sabiae]|nr:hypothetical protein PSAB6_590005 [Paraburkholderia sabiae]
MAISSPIPVPPPVMSAVRPFSVSFANIKSSPLIRSSSGGRMRLTSPTVIKARSMPDRHQREHLPSAVLVRTGSTDFDIAIRRLNDSHSVPVEDEAVSRKGTGDVLRPVARTFFFWHGSCVCQVAITQEP